jgi:hypothetical protein
MHPPMGRPLVPLYHFYNHSYHDGTKASQRPLVLYYWPERSGGNQTAKGGGGSAGGAPSGGANFLQGQSIDKTKNPCLQKGDLRTKAKRSAGKMMTVSLVDCPCLLVKNWRHFFLSAAETETCFPAWIVMVLMKIIIVRLCTDAKTATSVAVIQYCLGSMLVCLIRIIKTSFGVA